MSLADRTSASGLGSAPSSNSRRRRGGTPGAPAAAAARGLPAAQDTSSPAAPEATSPAGASRRSLHAPERRANMPIGGSSEGGIGGGVGSKRGRPQYATASPYRRRSGRSTSHKSGVRGHAARSRPTDRSRKASSTIDIAEPSDDNDNDYDDNDDEDDSGEQEHTGGETASRRRKPGRRGKSSRKSAVITIDDDDSSSDDSGSSDEEGKHEGEDHVSADDSEDERRYESQMARAEDAAIMQEVNELLLEDLRRTGGDSSEEEKEDEAMDIDGHESELNHAAGDKDERTAPPSMPNETSIGKEGVAKKTTAIAIIPESDRAALLFSSSDESDSAHTEGRSKSKKEKKKTTVVAVTPEKGGELLSVERILGRRYNRTLLAVEYLIWWGGYDNPKDYTWEPYDSLNPVCHALIQRRWHDRKAAPEARIELTDPDVDKERVEAYFQWCAENEARGKKKKKGKGGTKRKKSIPTQSGSKKSNARSAPEAHSSTPGRSAAKPKNNTNKSSISTQHETDTVAAQVDTSDTTTGVARSPIDIPNEWLSNSIQIFWPNDGWHIFDDSNKVDVYSYTHSDNGNGGGACSVAWTGGGYPDDIIDTEWRLAKRKRSKPATTTEDYLRANANRMKKKQKKMPKRQGSEGGTQASAILIGVSDDSDGEESSRKGRRDSPEPRNQRQPYRDRLPFPGGVKPRRDKNMPNLGGVKRGFPSAVSAASAPPAPQQGAEKSDEEVIVGGVYVGSRIAKRFPDGIIYHGTVTQFHCSDSLWSIKYDDSDTEDFTLPELRKAMKLYENVSKEKRSITINNSDQDHDDFGAPPSGDEYGDEANDNERDHSRIPSVDDDNNGAADDESNADADTGEGQGGKRPALKPIAPPLAAEMGSGIEILWKAGIAPFHLDKDLWELYDPKKVLFYEYTQRRSDVAGGLCQVSSEPHHYHPIKTAWRSCTGRRRRPLNMYKPPADALANKKPKRRAPKKRTPKSSLTFLELFSGSKCLSAAYKRKSVDCTTLDHDPKKNADYILSTGALRNAIDTGTVPPGLDGPFDIIHAAPCCTTYSLAAAGRHRNANNIEGHSLEAKVADKMIESLIEVLKFYQKHNKHVIITIENPDCYLPKTKYAERFIKELGLQKVRLSYCHLAGFCRVSGAKKTDEIAQLPQKHTVIWTNSANLLHVCRDDALRCKKDCGCRDASGRKHERQVQQYNDRMSAYPKALCEFLALNVAGDARLLNGRQSDRS